MKPIFETVMAPATGWADTVKTDQRLRVNDLEGLQVVDMAVFNDANLHEKLSTSYSRSRAGVGGFMFNVQELATAAQHGIEIVLVVFNDGAFGNVKRFQQQLFDGKEIAVELKNPDFMKLADAFGVQGFRVNSPAELERAIGEGFSTPGPTLIEYPLGEVPDPWHLIFQGKVRG